MIGQILRSCADSLIRLVYRLYYRDHDEADGNSHNNDHYRFYVRSKTQKRLLGIEIKIICNGFKHIAQHTGLFTYLDGSRELGYKAVNINKGGR